jgi:hypothetical protein
MATGRRARVRAWLRKWVGNPVASVVLVLALLADAFSLGRADLLSSWRGPSLFVFSEPPIHYGPEIYAVSGVSGLRWVYPEEDSWDELSDLLQTKAPPVSQCVFRESYESPAIWAQATDRYTKTLTIIPLTGEWSNAQLNEVREQLFTNPSMRPSIRAAMTDWTDLASGNIQETTILWGGVAHNAVAITLFAALLYSLTGWPAWFAAHPLSRRARRIARGLCPSCGYDLRGIEACLCPECGRPLTLDSP